LQKLLHCCFIAKFGVFVVQQLASNQQLSREKEIFGKKKKEKDSPKQLNSLYCKPYPVHPSTTSNSSDRTRHRQTTTSLDLTSQ
jgi:hypothetical protein